MLLAFLLQYVCWAELVIAQLLVPNASLWGHLCGILAGLLHVWLLGRRGPFAPMARRGSGRSGRGSRGGAAGWLWRALFGGGRAAPRTYGHGTWGGGSGNGGQAGYGGNGGYAEQQVRLWLGLVGREQGACSLGLVQLQEARLMCVMDRCSMQYDWGTAGLGWCYAAAADLSFGCFESQMASDCRETWRQKCAHVCGAAAQAVRGLRGSGSGGAAAGGAHSSWAEEQLGDGQQRERQRVGAGGAWPEEEQEWEEEMEEPTAPQQRQRGRGNGRENSSCAGSGSRVGMVRTAVAAAVYAVLATAWVTNPDMTDFRSFAQRELAGASRLPGGVGCVCGGGCSTPLF